MIANIATSVDKDKLTTTIEIPSATNLFQVPAEKLPLFCGGLLAATSSYLKQTKWYLVFKLKNDQSLLEVVEQINQLQQMSEQAFHFLIRHSKLQYFPELPAQLQSERASRCLATLLTSIEMFPKQLSDLAILLNPGWKSQFYPQTLGEIFKNAAYRNFGVSIETYDGIILNISIDYQNFRWISYAKNGRNELNLNF